MSDDTAKSDLQVLSGHIASLRTNMQRAQLGMNTSIHTLAEAFRLYVQEHPPENKTYQRELEAHLQSLQQQAKTTIDKLQSGDAT